MLLADPPSVVPSAGDVMARAAAENFPVASRMLPRRVRSHLLAVYGFARLVDELGDSAPGDRLGALDWLESELDRAYDGRAEHPLLARLQPSLVECSLPREPFARLIEANRVDQRVNRYDTWDELRAYCALSANPVGEIVLRVFAVATPTRIALSDSICTALQLTEHCQDVAEDLAAGRVYLPVEDLIRYMTAADVEALMAAALLAVPGDARGARAATRGGEDHADVLAQLEEPLRRVIAFEVARARELLLQGGGLLGELRGRERLAVAAFVAGGRAALDAIERARYDVRQGPPRAGRVRRALALAAVLAGGVGRGR